MRFIFQLCRKNGSIVYHHPAGVKKSGFLSFNYILTIYSHSDWTFGDNIRAVIFKTDNLNGYYL